MSTSTIEVQCEKCGKSGKVLEKMAGRRVKCPGCGNVIDVAHPSWEQDAVITSLDLPAENEQGKRRFADAVAEEPRTRAVVALSQKNVGIAILLTILFGPLGMFYSTIAGALIMLVVSLLLAVLTFGISIFITWPACVIWGAIAAHRYNQKLLDHAT